MSDRTSRLLGAVGTLLVIGGLSSVLLPAAANSPPKDEVNYIVGVLVVLCGVGIFLHKKWAYWMLLIGGFIAIVATLANNMMLGGTIDQIAIATSVVGLIVGVPMVLVWLRRDRFAIKQQDASSA